jgi:hypothetical protein
MQARINIELPLFLEQADIATHTIEAFGFPA